MSQASAFIGKPIVTPAGTQLETINDVVFDPQLHQVLCFIIAPGGGWFGGARILPWSDEFSFATNALIIPSQDQIVLARDVPWIQKILETIQVVAGKRILTSDERQIGILVDVYFDQNTGEIHEYEITAPTHTIDSNQNVALAPEEVDFVDGSNAVLVVSHATANLIESQIPVE